MTLWRSYHVYYTDADRLICECVNPLLRRLETRLDRRFWERHYAGGTHLRIRLGGTREAVASAGHDLVEELEHYLRARPSSDDRSYSEARAATLMEAEQEPPDPSALTYRNNVVIERPYVTNRKVYVSDEMIRLTQDFHHDVLPLLGGILAGSLPKREQMLQLYFLQALLVAQGDYPKGCVSYRSHWEGCAVGYPAPVVERIEASYQRLRDRLDAALLHVRHLYETGRSDADPILGEWRRLLRHYAVRAADLLAAGHRLTEQASTLEEVRASRKRGPDAKHRSRFFQTLARDERFFASIQYEDGFLVSRIATNLLYLVVAGIGLSPVDRYALCFYAHQAVYERYHCDYAALADVTVSGIIERNAHRWQG